MFLTPAVIVTGLPCTGKTTIAAALRKALRLPTSSKDQFKEVMFDTLGWDDRSWSKRLDAPCIELLFKFLENQIDAAKGCIIEHWFDAERDMARLVDMEREKSMHIIQVLCFSQGPILFERFKARAESGHRHPGHCDRHTYTEHEPILLSGRMKRLPTKGPLVEVDTSDFDGISIDGIIKQVEEGLRPLL